MDQPPEMMRAVQRATGKSAALLRAAADAGDLEAKFALGLLYMLGRGLEKNLGEAFKLFNEAAAEGDEQALAFKNMAIEQLAHEERERRTLDDAAVVVMKDAKRRQKYPKPKLVNPD